MKDANQSMWERDYYSHGLAVCEHSIVKDTTYCRFRDEEFEFENGGDIDAIIEGQGPRYAGERRLPMAHAQIAKLRKLKNNIFKRAANG